MIRTPDTDILNAIRRLKADPDFQKYMGWLASESSVLYGMLISSDDPLTKKFQGACSVLDTLSKVVAEADVIAQKRAGTQAT